MSSWPFTLLALLIGVAGWYYLFYSRAAHRLVTMENASANRRRIGLRRVNGAAMILLAALLYIATQAVDPHERPRSFVIVWLGIFVLLFVLVVLGLIDIRLTTRLRENQRREHKS